MTTQVLFVGSTSIGWKVKIGMELGLGGVFLAARCSCSDYVAPLEDGDGAWERLTQNVGRHIQEVHLKKLDGWS